MESLDRTQPTRPNPAAQFFQVVFSSAGIFLAAVFLIVVGYQVFFLGRILPNVSVAGIDVGGLSLSSASQKISAAMAYPQTGQIILTYGDHSWSASPNQLGFFLDSKSSARAAQLVGRTGTLVSALSEQLGTARYGRSVSLALIYDERAAFAALDSIASQIDVPPVEASISLNGTDVQVNQGQMGIELDRYASLAAIATQIQSLQNGTVALVVSEKPPLVQDVSMLGNTVRSILSEPFSITLPAGQPNASGPWTFDPPTLAGMLKFDRVSQDGSFSFNVQLDPASLRGFLANISASLSLAPQNPHFIFNDTTKLLELKTPAVIGRILNVEKSLTAVQSALSAGGHSAELVFDFTDPQVTDASTGQQLGITQLIHTEVSYFSGSSAARAQNIQTASEKFLGLLVAPGEVFSMGNALGDISLDNGYAEALIIYGNSTIKGVGGGVCQVSTTLFRAAFFSGFPILERHAHAYRVSYYELTASGRDPNLAGMDATVYFPLVDLKFKNDSPYWLLMEVYVNMSRQTITWKFYSTPDGRSVQYTSTGVTNVVPAPADVFRENPDLKKDDVKQVEWKADGAYVRIDRTVSKDGAVYFQDTFTTQYEPWGAVCEYGPGTKPIPTSCGN